MSFPLPAVPVPHPFDTALTPIFVPTSAHILAIESYYGMLGPGISGAFLYNPTNPKSGIAIDRQGRLAPVLEVRWREFERAVAGAQAQMAHPHEGGGWWSRPQNTTCPEDVTYDLGPANGGALTRFHLTGHTVSARYGSPDDVQWYTPTGETHTRDIVPFPFVEVERIISALREDLFPPETPFNWERTYVPVPIIDELRPMLRAIVRMVGIQRANRWGIGYPI
ncbi:hypothetical protein B0H17DRAFT_1331848 [Mycena rosella]|uniref:Uncharacterized protein n=1 Tax=Mycena rosella TaxID=1033263 RepID=A0AAD7DDU4_MYCRO|nr:hypothetical protein B0H17DRAFT_1331848 [Mycena rosella]